MKAGLTIVLFLCAPASVARATTVDVVTSPPTLENKGVDCTEYHGDVEGCDAAGGCGYYFCSEECHPAGTDYCDAGCISICPHEGTYTIFLNPHGATYTPGIENSSTNASSIVTRARDEFGIQSFEIPPFGGDEAAWDSLMRCMRENFSDFDVVITDEDPGEEPHMEAAVGGSYSNLGYPEGVPGFAGVAPGVSCGEVTARGITFNMSDDFGGDTDRLCWVVAQEIGHLFSLDHSTLCADAMTYDFSCGAEKSIVDEAAPCGEFAERACNCGSATQNSYQRLLEIIGPTTDSTPPEIFVEVSRQSGEIALVGRAEDPGGVDVISLWVQGEQREALLSDRFEFRVQASSLGEGMTVRIAAQDFAGNRGEELVDLDPPNPDGDDLGYDERDDLQASGCGCRAAPSASTLFALLFFSAAALALGRRRRSRS